MAAKRETLSDREYATSLIEYGAWLLIAEALAKYGCKPPAKILAIINDAAKNGPTAGKPASPKPHRHKTVGKGRRV